MSEHQRSFGGTTAIIGAVVLALLLGVGAAVLVLGRNSDAGANPQAPVPSPTGAASQSSSSACGLPDGDQKVPTADDLDHDWQLVNKLAVPLDPDIGPAETKGKVSSCFARNPTGALFAFTYYMADVRARDLDVRELLDRFTAGSQEAVSDEILSEPGEDDVQPMRIVGFRFLDNTEDRNVIELALMFGEGPRAGDLWSVTFSWAWEGGDWRLSTPGGRPTTDSLATLDGFQEWSGS